MDLQSQQIEAIVKQVIAGMKGTSAPAAKKPAGGAIPKTAKVAMLTEAFGSHGPFDSYQGAFVTIQIACDSCVYTLYDKECLIPCNGREHRLWLNKTRDEVKSPLRKFLINAALKPSKGTQP